MRRLLLVLLVTFTTTGCALIVDGKQQEIDIQTPGSGCAQCQLSNKEGTWQSTCTPEKIKVHRDYDPLTVSCTAPGQSGQTEVNSKVKGWFFGNILIGGLIGMGVDAYTDAAWDYPDTITVQMSNASGIYPTQTYAPYPEAPVLAPIAPAAPVAVTPRPSRAALPMPTHTSRYARPQLRTTQPAPQRPLYPRYQTSNLTGRR